MLKVSLRIVLCVAAAGCLPDPVMPRAAVPTVDDAGSHGFVSVSAGAEHACALTAAGDAHCWGSNEFGQLGAPSDRICPRGDAEIPCRARPVLVTGGLTFQKITAGGRVTCGLTTSGAIYCWGDNLHGGLGDPTLRASDEPVPIATTGIFVDVAAGAEHGCAIRSDGVALCWGLNDVRQLGLVTAGTSAGVPSPVGTNLRFVSVSAGARRTCARQSTGATFCWGATWVLGPVGEDAIRTQTAPLRMQSGIATQFTSVSPGTSTTCGLTANNDAYCWEANSMGSIGDGTAEGSETPRPVRGGHRFVSIASGAAHSCGVDDAGRAWCWGDGARGQLGVSSSLLNGRCGAARQACSSVPVPVSDDRRYAQISLGQGDTSCGLTLTGNVFCWGAASMGQRGDGRVVRSDPSPVRTLAPSAM